MDKKTIGYYIYVDYAHAKVDFEKNREFEDYFKKKYDVNLDFPLGGMIGGRRNDSIRILKRNINLLDDVLEICEKFDYRVEGIKRILDNN
ncbi:hypothetical protein KAU11_09115 [Candidatus Babeliales bacterium]|nr:hypothetical protein [Candidatus Babeliales bacterium]